MGHIAFSDLLAPHRVVKTVILKQGLVRTGFDNSAALKNVNAVGMRECSGDVRSESPCDRDLATRHA